MEQLGRVAIVGGGIAGLALVRALADRGLEAVAFETAPAAARGLAINLPGNAVRALNELGLEHELKRIGQPNSRREYRTASGRLLFAVDESRFWRGAGSPMAVRRSALLDILGRGLPAGALQSGKVLDCRSAPNGATLQLEAGTDVHARLVVGADGIGSIVRQRVEPKGGRSRARLASSSWRFVLPNPGVDCWTLWAGPHSMLLLLPLPNDEVYGWAALNGETDIELALLDRAFEAFPNIVKRVVEAVAGGRCSVHHSPLEEVRLAKWSHNAFVLIGDAAHATAPVWAEGVAMALEDALVLAELLSTRQDWENVPALFEARRRPRVEHVQAMTDGMSKAARLPYALRNCLLPFLGPWNYHRTYRPLLQPA